MVQHCPDDSTIVRGNVLPRAVLVLDASPARPPRGVIGLSAETAISQCVEPGLLLVRECFPAVQLMSTQTLRPPQAISGLLCLAREIWCRHAVGFNSLSRTVAAHLLQEVCIELAGEGNHQPQSRRPEPALKFAIPTRVHAILGLFRGTVLRVCLLPLPLEGFRMVLCLGPLEKVLSLDLVSHLCIQRQSLLSEPSLTKFNDSLELLENEHFGNHRFHVLLFPRLSSTRNPKVLIDGMFFLAKQQQSELLELPLD